MADHKIKIIDLLGILCYNILCRKIKIYFYIDNRKEENK